MPERKLVREFVGRAAHDRGVARGLSGRTAAQQSWRSNPQGVCASARRDHTFPSLHHWTGIILGTELGVTSDELTGAGADAALKRAFVAPSASARQHQDACSPRRRSIALFR